MDCDGVRRYQSFKDLAYSEEDLKPIKPFQHVEKPISCILHVPTHEKYELHLLEIQHFIEKCHHLQDGVISIFSAGLLGVVQQ